LNSLEKYKKQLIAGGIGLFIILLIWTQSQQIHIIDKTDLLMRSSTKTYPTRSLNQINKIIVHHSASIGQTAEDHARYHVLSKKWAGIAYTFVIERPGDIIQTNFLETISNNTKNQNTSSISICLSGDFTKEDPSPEQLKSLKKLIIYLRKILPQTLDVGGHKDYRSTSCPGPMVYEFINQFKLAA
jgi:hypothetical protein